jgi:hypothetical protein
MGLATAIFKTVAYKLETVFGTAAGAVGAQLLRRTESSLTTKRDQFKSNEIRTDWQIGDIRLGIRRVDGNIKGDLSPGTYKDLFAAALRRLFVADAAATGLTITIAAGSGVTYSLTRTAGSWITDGLNTGDIGRFTAGAFNAANLNKNLLVVGVSALALNVIVLNGTTLTAEGPIATATFTPTGKKTFMPSTGHTDSSFTIEHFFSDISQSELFMGCKLSNFDIAIPASGLATVQFGVIGQDMQSGAVQYYTAPSAVTSSGFVAGVNGVLLAGTGATTPMAICTGVNIKCALNLSGDPVVGSQHVASLFPGIMTVTGSFTAYFQDAIMRDAFLAETEQSLTIALTTNSSATADFLAFTLPRIKMTSADKADAVGKGIVQTFNYEGLMNTNGGLSNNGDITTLMMQDSLA